MAKKEEQKEQANSGGPKGPDSGSPPDVGGESRRVEVVGDGCLGPKLLKRGNVTDDPDIVALLDHPTKSHLVRLVEEAAAKPMTSDK